MDFVTGLRGSRGFDGIWVIVDHLTKSAHFLPVRMTWSAAQLADLFIQQIIKLHGVSTSIVSDRDGRFTSHLWGQVHSALGTQLNFTTAYHP